MKKQLLAAAAVATIGASSLGMIGFASAASNKSTSNSDSLVDKIATKFGLKKSDVQAVFDENHSAHQAKRQQKIADMLADGVKDGTITQVQSDAITAKIKELQTKFENNRAKFESMTGAERKAAIETERTALEQWLKDNKIPDEYTRFLRGPKHMGGPRGDKKMHGGMLPNDNETNQDTN